MEQLPLDIVYYEILPWCDIDTRLAFKVPPKKLVLWDICVLKDRHTFVRIANSHMQIIKWFHMWHAVLFDCMRSFTIDVSEEDYWFCLLVLLPQLKIVHGSKWRDAARQIVSNADILNVMDIGYDPDISIYTRKFE